MEAIKNYLESMFANLPNTPEVQKAKTELLQMMEDKYTSLLEEGKKENEAVGIVISEFGNLDEIAETLGISGVMKSADHKERRHVSREEASQYVIDCNKHALLKGLGVLFCIISPVAPIVFDAVYKGDTGDAVGASLLFVSIAAAVGIFIYTASIMKKWDFLKKEPCSIDYQTAEELGKEQKMNESGKTVCLIAGILLCIISLVPMTILTELPSSLISDMLSPSIMFIMVGIGVMLIIFSSGRDSAYKLLLGLNDTQTVAGNYNKSNNRIVYDNKTVDMIMTHYWFTVRCVFLIWSFLTFAWYKTWLIWPVAAIIHRVLKNGCGKEIK